LDLLSRRIIGCAIEVHRHLGPGLLENSYEAALCLELGDNNIAYQRQLTYPLIYKGRSIGEYRIDVIVEDLIIIEVKSVERFDPVFQAQVLSYLRATGKKLGLLINFNTQLLKQGIRRFIL